jgi:hypothetical protein
MIVSVVLVGFFPNICSWESQKASDRFVDYLTLALATVPMLQLLDFPHDVLLVLLEAVAEQAPTSLITLASSSTVLWNLYSRPHTKLGVTRAMVKGHLGDYFETAKAVVIVEGFGFHLAELRRLEKEKRKDQVELGGEGYKESRRQEDEDALIFQRNELELLRATYTLHQTILAIIRMLLEERGHNPLPYGTDEYGERYVDEEMSFAIEDLVHSAYLDRGSVWGDNEMGHCKAELSQMDDKDDCYFQSIDDQLPRHREIELYRTEYGVDQWGLLTEHYQIDFGRALEDGGEQNWSLCPCMKR